MKNSEKTVLAAISVLITYIAMTFLTSAQSFKGGFDIRLFLFALTQNVAMKLFLSICVGFIVYLWDTDTLNETKSRTVGDNQHGSARFATDAECRKVYTYVSPGREQKSGIVLAKQKHIWIVDTTEDSVILVAPPGTGKTKCIINANIIYNALCFRNVPKKSSSMIILDNKGECLKTTGGALRKLGYKTPYLDFRNPLKSYCYNLMINVNNAIDRYKSAKTDEERIISYALAEKHAKILANSIISNINTHKSSSESFFDDTSKGLVTGMILLVSIYGESDERHIISVFKLIVELNGLEEGSTATVQKSRLEGLLKFIDDDRIINYVGPATTADSRTSMNVFSSALAHLVDFIDAELEQMICTHSIEFDSEDFIKNPTAIYIICPDDNTTRHFFASLFIRSLMNELIAQAESNPSSRLDRNVLCVWDEFGNTPPIKDVDVLITAARSRGIRFILSLQSLSQLSKIYGREISEIIRDAVQMMMFSRVSPSSETTANTLSKLLGNRTVLSASESKSSGKRSVTKSMIGKPLMSPDELTRIPIGTWIVTKAGAFPCKIKAPMLSDSVKNLPPFEDRRTVKIGRINYLSSAKIKGKTKGRLTKGMFD